MIGGGNVRIASLSLLAALLLMGCASAPSTGNPQAAAICASSAQLAASPDRPKCVEQLSGSPDLDLLFAALQVKAGISASGVPDQTAEFRRLIAPIDEESRHRIAARKSLSASGGAVDCAGWHWDNAKLSCQP
jgi:hypothetical protein